MRHVSSQQYSKSHCPTDRPRFSKMSRGPDWTTEDKTDLNIYPSCSQFEEGRKLVHEDGLEHSASCIHPDSSNSHRTDLIIYGFQKASWKFRDFEPWKTHGYRCSPIGCSLSCISCYFQISGGGIVTWTIGSTSWLDNRTAHSHGGQHLEVKPGSRS
jgi:hypothetical protein